MSATRSFMRIVRRAMLLAIAALSIIVMPSDAAYRISRPISIGTYGYINQYNLYGEGTGSGHKGIDFPVSTGSNVYAVASGRVVDLYEGWKTGCVLPRTK